MRTLWVLCVLFITFASPATAAPDKDKSCKKLPKEMASALGSAIHQKDEFVVHYHATGPNAIQEKADLNGNTIPDAVEDVATKLIAMREMLTSNGFVHPFKQPRYQQVRQIHAIMLPVKGNGVAYESPRTMPDGTCALIIHVDNDVSSENITPAHELFHLFQYGYTMFKRPWYLEGMARWSESMLRATPPKTAPLPKSNAELTAFFDKKYDAVGVWYALTTGVDPVGQIKVPESAANLRYVSGKKMVQDDKLPGVAFMRAVLEGLDKLDDQISTAQGLTPFGWSESMQRDQKHDLPMWKLIETLYHTHGPTGRAAP
ncbi:MAG: hypothetical protein G8237_08730 [Magnetococcales bacterium]|nr:hypothetical protein [Magnetococcales bacterium]